jgi:glycosyltransferase involved in cell wall biosynthesis
MHTVVVIPAYNEARTISEVVRNVREVIPDVIVIDDGSDDATAECARHAGARVITHCINRGLGAALGTGLAAALAAGGKTPARGKTPDFEEPSEAGREKSGVEERADVIITMDADGQHDPVDIPALIAPIQAGLVDVVIGTRFACGKTSDVDGKTPDVEEHATPLSRRAFNSLANLLTHLLFNVRCSDTQSGFRAFSRRAASLIEIRTNRMEVSSEILAEAARLGLRITEVPVRTIYTPYSLSKGQSFAMGMRTAWSLLLRRLF